MKPSKLLDGSSLVKVKCRGYMMKYGIIVCPKCKSAKGVILAHKTTKCNRCSKTLTLEKMRILYKTDSQQKLRNSIGLVNAEMDGQLKKFKKQSK